MEELNTIIHNAKQGEVKAMSSLYNLYMNRWFILCLRYSRSRDEAQDILQEGTICIFKNLKQYDPVKSKFITWSNRVIINAALKFLKRTSWQNSFSDIDEVLDYEMDNVQIDDFLSAQYLIDMIAKLPLGYKLVFNLYAIEGHSHAEIAEMLNISIGTSKSQLFKARKVLKECIEKQLV